MTPLEIGIFVFVLVVIPTIALAITLWAAKGKMYVIQPDNQSAKIGECELCLIDKDSRRIWIKRKNGQIIVYTVHDTLPFEPNRTWCVMNNHDLHFTRTEDNAFVHWGPELSVHHE